MDDFSRIIDVNLNRASEGLRVVEEVIRHLNRDERLFNQVRSLRHRINQTLPDSISLILSRESASDPGRMTEVPERLNTLGLIRANLKRAQEAIRVLEEVSQQKQSFMAIRFDLYSLEKELIQLNPLLTFDARCMRVYVIASEVDVLLRAAAQGVQMIQLRDKQSSSRQLIEKANQINTQLANIPQKVFFIINDRPDIARLTGADGVHIGQEDMTVAQARQILGRPALVGKSTHALEQALAAYSDGADYIGVGPVWATPTKVGREAVGLDYVRQVAAQVRIPFVAIGGINLDNVDQVMAAGATCIAFVRATDQIPQLLVKLNA